MITKLTDEQKNKMPEYVKKWVDIGLSTADCNRELAEKNVSEAYISGGLTPPKKFFWSNSPMEGIYQIIDNDDNIKDKEAAKKDNRILSGILSNFCYGNHDAHWLAYYSFMLNELKITDISKLSPLIELAENSGWWSPYENAVFLQEKPLKIYRKDNVLHCDRGPSVIYRDGYSIYSLNGISVTKEIAETPGDKLDVNLFLKEKNVDVRREIVRKIGNERICNELNAKCIDKSKDGMYELLILDLNDGRRRPFLKMINPSIGIYHIEGVHPDCDTVAKALEFRNGVSGAPITLT